jgi:large subunit ribosomal protein L29
MRPEPLAKPNASKPHHSFTVDASESRQIQAREEIMKATKLREADVAALEKQAQEMNEQLFHLRFKINMGQNEGVKKMRELKKDRARVLTILRERKSN